MVEEVPTLLGPLVTGLVIDVRRDPTEYVAPSFYLRTETVWVSETCF
jgi:hypothetical protein